jgi:hypothetical protein
VGESHQLSFGDDKARSYVVRGGATVDAVVTSATHVVIVNPACAHDDTILGPNIGAAVVEHGAPGAADAGAPDASDASSD